MAKLGYFLCIPFAFLLRWFYNLTGSYGWAIILFTLIVKLIMLPFQMKSKRNMVRMGRLSGRQQELQKQYANNQQKLNEEMAKLCFRAAGKPVIIIYEENDESVCTLLWDDGCHICLMNSQYKDLAKMELLMQGQITD